MNSKSSFSESTENLAPLGRVESPDALVVGTSQLFEGNTIRYIPMPTPDPRGSYTMYMARSFSDSSSSRPFESAKLEEMAGGGRTMLL